MKDLIIRPSTVTSWMLCPGRQGYRNHDGFNHYPNEALLFGSLVHWIVEQNLLGESPSFSRCEKELHNLFIKDLPESVKAPQFLVKLTTKAQRDAIVKEARAAADEWYARVLPKLPPLDDALIEHTMKREAGIHDGEYRVFVRGTADLIVPEHGYIIDWKTAGKQWDAKKVEGQLQTIAYPWLADGEDMNIKKFTFWVYDRSSGWWGEHKQDVKLHSHRVGAFRMTAVNAAVQIEEGTWTWHPGGQAFHATRGWHCSPKYCDAWSVCWGKHLIQDDKQDVPAIKLKEKFE